MKKLRFFDSLKFVVAVVTATFILNVANAATLPAGYTELEYLESTGEQYVELSFGFDPTDMILADFSVNIEEYSDKYMVAPKVWSSNHNKFAMGVHQGIYTIAYKDFTTSSTALIPSKRNDGQIHKWIYGGYVFSIPELNTSRDVSDITFRTTTSNIRLFYGYQGGTKGKISYYKHVKANGTSVELIPARRDSDGALGMYDLADANPETAFHTNAGTGEFVAGPAVSIKIATTRYNEQQFAPVQNELSNAMDAVDDVVTRTMSQAQAIDQIATNKQTRPDEGCLAKYCLLVEDEDGTPHWYPIAGANGVEYVLPSGYTELQYLQTDGDSWIDTGILLSNTDTFEITFQSALGTLTFPVMGAISGGTSYTSTNNLSVTYNTMSGINAYSVYCDGAAGHSNYSWNGGNYADKLKHTIKYNGLNIAPTIDGVAMTQLVTHTLTENNPTVTTWLFGRNNTSTGTLSQAGVRIYNVNIQGKGHFIPAKRNSDNVVGMYDMVSGQFFTNAGTGDFTAGPEM